ncbi:MAG TPA: restriction endonuclease [Streptosporangiaceae bacterium]|nr:restriction endonuclease [Streptosporangiaceae bacterium]
MARRSSFVSAIAQMQREAARAQAAQVRAQTAARREADRARAAYLRAQAADDRERKRLYTESRAAEVAAKNDDLEAEVATLQRLLVAALPLGDRIITFSSLKKPAVRPPWRHSDLERPTPVPVPEAFLPSEPAGLAKVFGKGKYEQAVAEGRAQYEVAVQQYRAREEQRSLALAKVRAEWQATVDAADAEARKQHEEVDAFEADYRRGVPDAAVAYCSMMLEASQYPPGFPQKFKLAYVPESQQAVVEYELPTVDAIPAVKAYKYVKTSDTITESPRPQTQIKALYASVVAQVAIRTVHELFGTDLGRHIDTVVFNGVVDTTDPGSGRRVRPCLVTLRTTREVFGELDLAHVEPLACLKHLSAGVSKSPSELVPVRPVLEFNMVDPRFVAESDALSELDQRPNLMELSPTEFESLIQNLFTKMGLEARQTRPSRDGGVDCVAWDPRPIFGGKVVIQAKRYKNTVGVSAVRDLFGTLQNEGASKGILVTTSGYGQASFDFAQNKPIELIDGANLLYLLSEHAGIEAKIMAPTDWKDPAADIPERTS